MSQQALLSSKVLCHVSGRTTILKKEGIKWWRGFTYCDCSSHTVGAALPSWKLIFHSVLIFSKINFYSGNQPCLLHVTLIDGFCSFEEALCSLCLIPACPEDTQLVLKTQGDKTWASNDHASSDAPTIAVWLLKKCSSALFITLHKHSDGVFSKIIHSIIITCHRVNTYSYQWSYHNFCM